MLQPWDDFVLSKYREHWEISIPLARLHDPQSDIKHKFEISLRCKSIHMTSSTVKLTLVQISLWSI